MSETQTAQTPKTTPASKLTEEQLLSFCRLDPDYTSDGDVEFLALAHAAALTFVKKTCGIDDEYLDSDPNLAIATLVLVRDMYDNRSLLMKEEGMNPTVQGILALHDHNLL